MSAFLRVFMPVCVGFSVLYLCRSDLHFLSSHVPGFYPALGGGSREHRARGKAGEPVQGAGGWKGRS